jgi:hypothetical protein
MMPNPFRPEDLRGKAVGGRQTSVKRAIVTAIAALPVRLWRPAAAFVRALWRGFRDA